MKTTEKTLKELYKIGNKETKEKLELEFPTLFKTKTLLDSAIEYLTEKDEEVVKLRKLETLTGIDNLLAEQKLVVIFKAKNEKHIFDWSNKNEYKYFIWFKMDENNFSYVNYYNWNTISAASARLCLKSADLVKELANNEEIKNYFKTYMLQK